MPNTAFLRPIVKEEQVKSMISEYQLVWIASAGDYVQLHILFSSKIKLSLNMNLKENNKASKTLYFAFIKKLETLVNQL